MTKEAKRQSQEEIEKLVIDKPSDFRFRAAYLAYSEAWDQSSSEEIKTELNQIILSLSKEEISYSDFYKKLGQYGNRGSQRYMYPRKRIETQRKRDWRKRQTREARNARHRRRR
jgi:hypothetical protein